MPGAGQASSCLPDCLRSQLGQGAHADHLAQIAFEKVHSLLTQQDTEPGTELGKLAALSGVREFPSRVKCASLCWHTLNAALDRSVTTVSTE